jgi:hypothetical protein
MGIIDVNRLLEALVVGQTYNVRSGVTIRIDSARRAGDGTTLILFGEITKDGQVWVPPGGWPIIWISPTGGATTNEARAIALVMLDGLIT